MKLFSLVTAKSSERDLSQEHLGSAYVHAEDVPYSLLPAASLLEMVLLLLLPLMYHITGCLLSLLLRTLTYSLPSSSKTPFLHTLLNSHPHFFLQSVLLTLSVLVQLRAPVIRTQVLFSCSSRKGYLQPFLMSTVSPYAKIQ